MEFINVLYGSQNYGLNNVNSDKDYLHIVIPTMEEVYCGREPQEESQEDEHNSFIDIRKWFALLLRANPNALEVLSSTRVDCYNSAFAENIYYNLKNSYRLFLKNNLKGYYCSMRSTIQHMLTHRDRAIYRKQTSRAIQFCQIVNVNMKQFIVNDSFGAANLAESNSFAKKVRYDETFATEEIEEAVELAMNDFRKVKSFILTIKMA